MCLRGPLRAHFDSVEGGWAPLLQGFADGTAGRTLCAAVDKRLAAGASVYPPDPFLALRLTPPGAVRAVVLGQDPYHGPGQAEGLAFSVAGGQRWPPSLRNILQEWQRDLGRALPVSGSLRAWAAEGVLLLNAALTVEDGQPGVHARLGWQVLTNRIMRFLAADPAPKAFMLWGGHAQTFAPAVQGGGVHLALCCNHPSPLSARRGPVPFVGCAHFSAAQRFLRTTSRGELTWQLP
jgi:uracil-DNA glycosylase